MERNEFNAVMKEIGDYFGEKNFPPKVSDVVWQVVRRISKQEFRQVVNVLVEESTRPPSPAAIRKAAGPYIRNAELAWRNAEIKKLEGQTERCMACGGSGYVFAMDRENPALEYSFACHQCHAPRVRGFKVVKGSSNDPKAVREWDDSLKEKFIPVSHRLESLEKATAYRLSRTEATVCLNWMKRLKENPHSLQNFVKARGVVPPYLREFLVAKNLGHFLARGSIDGVHDEKTI